MSAAHRFEKLITFCGQRARAVCDGRCDKAWGLDNRLRVLLGDGSDPDNFAWLSERFCPSCPDPGALSDPAETKGVA